MQYLSQKLERLKELSGLFSPSDFDRLGKCDVLLISHDLNKPFIFDGLAYGPLVDSIKEIIDRLGVTSLCLSKPISKLRASDTYANSLNINRPYILFKLVEKFLGRLVNIDERTFWKKIILKTCPNCIIAIQPPPALCAAGKSMSVPVYDLQHGIIESSVYYNKRLAIKFGVSGFPDGVLVWDCPSEQAVASCLPGVTAFRIGNPWLERFINPPGSDRLVESEQTRVEHICNKAGPKILISLQWDRDLGSKIDMPSFVHEALRQLSEKGWVIFVRFHPVQLNLFGIEAVTRSWIRMTRLDFDGMEVVEASFFALPALLKCVNAHVTGHSAVAVDSSHMKVPSLLWRNDGAVKEWFKHYIDNGAVHMLADAGSNGIVSWAENIAALQRDSRGQGGLEERGTTLHHSLLEELCQQKPAGF